MLERLRVGPNYVATNGDTARLETRTTRNQSPLKRAAATSWGELAKAEWGWSTRPRTPSSNVLHRTRTGTAAIGCSLSPH